MWRSLFRFLVGLDQACNPLVYGGSENVTISSQTAYYELMLGSHVRRRKLLDWLFSPMEKQHCYNSLLVELHEFSADDEEALIKLLMEHGVSK